MGLDGYVSCNCYKEGKTKPFPIPEYEKYFSLGESGMWEFELEWEAHKNAHREIDHWKLNACSHDDMEFLSQRVGNWFSVQDFKTTLSTVGLAHFPTLSTELPRNNGGTMSSAKAAKVLTELEYFNQLADVGTRTTLFNSETGEVIQSYLPSSSGIFVWGTAENADLGIDGDGFFILERSESNVPKNTIDSVTKDTLDAAFGRYKTDPSRSILFRAMRLEQRPFGERVEFFDPDTEARFISSSAIHQSVRWPDDRWENDEGKCCIIKPQLLHVAERQISPKEYDFIVHALIRLCQASVETGNPVVWS